MLKKSREIFKQARQRRKLTQLEVVYRCRQLEPSTKLRPDQISSYENGKATLHSAELDLMSRALDYPTMPALLAAESEQSERATSTGFDKELFAKLLPINGYKSAPELARVIGCNQSTVCNWLNGRSLPAPHYQTKLREALKIRGEELFRASDRAAEQACSGPSALQSRLRGSLAKSLRAAKLRVNTSGDWTEFTRSLISALQRLNYGR